MRTAKAPAKPVTYGALTFFGLLILVFSTACTFILSANVARDSTAYTNARAATLSSKSEKTASALQQTISDATTQIANSLGEGFSTAALQTKENKDYALWALGRTVVSDASGKDVVLEINPANKAFSIASDISLDGHISVTGSVAATKDIVAASLSTNGFTADAQGNIEAEGLTTRKNVDIGGTLSVNSGSFEVGLDKDTAALSFDYNKDAKQNELAVDGTVIASAFASAADSATVFANSTEFSGANNRFLGIVSVEKTLNAAEISASGAITCEKVSTNMATTNKAEIESLSASEGVFDLVKTEAIEAISAQIDRVSCSSVDATDVGANSIDAAIITAAETVIQTATIEVLEANKLTADSGVFEALKASSLFANTATFNSLKLTSLDASSSTIGTLCATTVKADSLEASTIGGTLKTLELTASSIGTVEFPAVTETGEGLQESIAIDVPEGTYAVFLSPSGSMGTHGVWASQDEQGAWSIHRSFTESDKVAMENGEFEALDACSVSWLAVSLS